MAGLRGQRHPDQDSQLRNWHAGEQEDPTKTETGSSPQNITVDFLAETFTISGMQLHNNIPGEGRVAHETGTITFPIEVIDPETGEFSVDFETCPSLGRQTS